MTVTANNRWQVLLVAACMLAVCGLAAGARAAGFAIHAHRQGSAVAIEASATLQVPLALIWETLTDYDGLSSFVPGMHASRVIERRGPAIIVKQQGEAGFLFFSHAIDVVVEVREQPPYAIAVRVLSGNLKQLDGRYLIEPDAKTPGRYVLRWTGLIEPESRLPPLIGVPILRANIGEQFRGLVSEIERRASLQAK